MLDLALNVMVTLRGEVNVSHLYCTVVGERPAHAKLGSPAGASDITARFPLPQVRGTAIFPPIFLERQTSSDPYLSIYLSRRVGLTQGGDGGSITVLLPECNVITYATLRYEFEGGITSNATALLVCFCNAQGFCWRRSRVQ